MINVIETNEKIILVCNYKNEQYILDDIIAAEFPETEYITSKYREKPAIFFAKNVLPENYQFSVLTLLFIILKKIEIFSKFVLFF